jgi:hypothetical protein
MTYACNPSYLGGGELKDLGSSPALAKSLQDSISANKLSVVIHVCKFQLSAGSWSEASPSKNTRTCTKITKAKKAGGVARVIECVLSKYEVMSSNPSSTKK